MSQSLDEEIFLPVTEKEFDDLIDAIIRAYPEITNKDHAVAVVSIAIRHLPNDQATTTLKYLGHTVLKNIANHIANFKGEKIKHETMVNEYYNKVVSDPGDMQARDQLDKWALEGSLAAKDAVTKLELKKDTKDQTESNVLPFETA